MENWKYIGAVLTGTAAMITAITSIPKWDKRQLSPQRVGIIQDADGWTNLRQLPDTNSKVLTRLANQTEIGILNQSGNWYQIQTKNNMTGFVFRDNILEK